MPSPFRRRGLLRLTYAAPSAVRLVTGLLVVIALGTLALLLPGMATSGRLRFDQALFMATSAASVTGLSVITPARDLTVLGQVVLMVLMEIGGVGFMVLAVFVLLILGRKIMLADRLALQDSLGLSAVRTVVQIALRTLVVVLIMQGLGALALAWRWTPLLGAPRALWFGLFHAVSAFCNVGLDLFAGMPGYSGIPTDPVTLAVLAALIVAGGLGIPVWSDLLFHRGRWSLHTRVTLAITAALIVGGAAAILASEHLGHGVLTTTQGYDQFDKALFISISARTGGFSSIVDLGKLSEASTWVITVLMFVGTAPASMGGGITTGTLAVLLLATWSYLRGLSDVRVGMRSISRETMRRALAVLVMALTLVISATWLLLISQPIAESDALFTVVSAFATAGFNTVPLENFSLFGQFVVIVVMFWGRLGALTIVLAVARQSPPQPVSYPEETLLLG
ncbi:MAG: potassium transporter TrkG [Anaerolineae bacterium]